MQLTSHYFATAPGFCALCGRWYFDLGWWFAMFPSSAVPVFTPAFLYALRDGRWVCEECAFECDPGFCQAWADCDSDNFVAYLNALEAAGSNPYHYCCLGCCPPWRKATNGCPLSKSRREEILWMVHNCTCAIRPAVLEELRKIEGEGQTPRTPATSD